MIAAAAFWIVLFFTPTEFSESLNASPYYGFPLGNLYISFSFPKAGQPRFKATRRVNDAHPIEAVGENLRAMMPWIAQNKFVDKRKN
jgi:hypothetical protein